MSDSSQNQAQNEPVVIIHDSDLLDILENFPDQINGMQALLKRLRIMLRMSKGNINHWHWAAQTTWMEWSGIPLHNETPYRRLEKSWLAQGWIEKTHRTGKTNHVRLGKIFDQYRFASKTRSTQIEQGGTPQIEEGRGTQIEEGGATQIEHPNSQYSNSQKLKSHKLSVCEEKKPTHTGWVSNYSPETVVNRLADLGCIKTGTKGFIENVRFWNKEARDSLGALQSEELTEFIVYTKKSLGRGKLKPTDGILSNMLTAWHSREKQAISTEPQYFEETDYLEIKDDCPF